MNLNNRNREKVFWAVSLACMLVFCFNRGWRVGNVLYVTKTLSVLALLYLGARYAEGRYNRFSRNVIIGLAFIVAGDIYLLGLRVVPNFLPGLICLLLGYLFYIAAFSDGKPKFNRKAAIAVAAAGAAATAVLAPSLVSRWPSMIAPVLLYAAAALAMVYYGATRGIAVLTAGVILSALSDSLLVYNRFVRPLQWLPIMIWVTHYAGQALIVFSIKKQEDLAGGHASFPEERPAPDEAPKPVETKPSSSLRPPRSLRKPKGPPSA